MHKRASNFELVEPLVKPERTLNRRLRRRNRRVPFERRDERPEHQRVIYPPILDINHFRHFLNLLEIHNPVDDEPMWVADRVVASTPCLAITILETANRFSIKEEDFNAFLDEGSKILYSIDETPPEDKIFAEFDEFMAMNIKENTESESKLNKEETTFKKITFDTDYKIKKSLNEPPTKLELKRLPNHIEYAFLEEPFFLPMIISSQLYEQNKINPSMFSKDTSKPLHRKPQTILVCVRLSVSIKFNF
nr:reverse transcriptase domain-containing protein [Tanacetum cinerariifolium]